MGHSSIKVTFDLYGPLMPGTEVERRHAIEYAKGSVAHLAVGRNLADELIAAAVPKLVPESRSHMTAADVRRSLPALWQSSASSGPITPSFGLGSEA
jgi:hypothetical protein